MVSTGRMIFEYLDANGFDINDLAEASGVSPRTLFRVITSQESKVSYEIAQGVNKLIPEISIAFVMKYDAEYQIERRKAANDLGVKDISNVIKEYKLDKLYKEKRTDKIELVNIAERIFGKENIANNYFVDVGGLSFNFSRASNPNDRLSLIWLKAAYEECKQKGSLLKYNRQAFLNTFDLLKVFSGATSINTALFNMKYICEACGINFYYRPSIPGSRVKAVAVKDKNGYIYIFVSDLFKCVENLWLAFTHEMIHIYKEDYDKVETVKKEQIDENENLVEEAVILYFIQTDRYDVKECDEGTVNRLSVNNSIPINISAEIVRFLTGVYNNKDVNKFIHYYDSAEIDLNMYFENS